MTGPGILFDVPWCAISQPAMAERAGDPKMDLWLRVWLTALGRANRIGHAEFAAGELAELLPVLAPRTGELKTPSASTLSHAITAGKSHGMLEALSSVRCLVLPSDQFNKAGLGTAACYFHRVNTRGPGRPPRLKLLHDLPSEDKPLAI